MDHSNVCNICYEGNNLIKTKCNHHFHKQCLEKWYTNHESGHVCPCCRTDICEKNPKYHSANNDSFSILLDLYEISSLNLDQHEDLFGAQSMSDDDFEYFVDFFQLRRNANVYVEVPEVCP